MADALASARAAPIVGSHLGTPSSVRDRAALDDRADVAVYTSDDLAMPLQIAGRMAADLHTTCNMPNQDAQRTLSILPTEYSRAPTSGWLRVTTLRIAHGAAHPSRLLLPVVPA